MKKIINNFLLKNKYAIVVGGSGQIGKETCHTLLSAGAKVINMDIYDNVRISRIIIFIK